MTFFLETAGLTGATVEYNKPVNDSYLIKNASVNMLLRSYFAPGQKRSVH